MVIAFEAAIVLRGACLQAALDIHSDGTDEEITSSVDSSKAKFVSLGGTSEDFETALSTLQGALSEAEPEATICNQDVPKSAAHFMALNLGRYFRYKRMADNQKAQRALNCALRHFHKLHWKHPAWRGANLGGWLLLEPGPASPLFENVKAQLSAGVGGCEWTLCQALDKAHTHGGPSKAEIFDQHRETHFTAETFTEIANAGLNAVRIPFGYWIVTGPSAGDAYHGPALSVLDRAVALAKDAGLQVVLDLHGCPGGENALRPCGRKQPGWSWQQWRRGEAVDVLRVVAARYRDAEHVTGIQVCNEPSPAIPAGVLCDYYEQAIEAVRGAGMGVGRTAVVLPVFTQWRLEELQREWVARGNALRFDNIAWDLHLYHDFHPAWSLLSHRQHCDVVKADARALALLPGCVVGEWSLARPGTYSEEEVADFASAQVRGYNHALHGWFFWNWHDYEVFDKWDMRRGAFGRRRLPAPLNELACELVDHAWEVDGWATVPRGSVLSAPGIVSLVGRWIADPLVGLFDGGIPSLWRGFW